MKTIELLRKNRKEIYKIAEKHGVSNIRVFGSVARGEETKNSDVDLLVDFDVSEVESGFELIRFEREIAAKLNRKFDVVPRSGLYHLLEKQILDEAVSL